MSKAVKVAGLIVAMGLASPGLAVAEPLPGVPDIPEVDETFALDYALSHQREICSLFDYRYAQPNPNAHPLDAVINEVAARGGFNYETAGFAIGAAMASSCPQYLEPVEEALGIEFTPIEEAPGGVEFS